MTYTLCMHNVAFMNDWLQCIGFFSIYASTLSVYFIVNYQLRQCIKKK